MSSDRPNIVLIVADDLGWMDLTCQGSSFYETPNIDRLADEGMMFTDAYAACPVCSPTRASIQTGKYPARVGITQYIGGKDVGLRMLDVPYLHYLPKTETSIGVALRDGGYQTWHVGKWHLGGEGYYPEDHGYDINHGGCHMGAPGWPGGYVSPWRVPMLADADVPDGTYIDDYLTDRLLDEVDGRDPAKPFFVNWCPYLVHTPLTAPDHLVEKYTQKAIDMGLDDSQALETGELHPRATAEHTYHVKRRRFQSHAVYAGMIEMLDTNVGKLLDKLDELGIADQTMVIFTSDNGGLATSEGSPTCNFPLKEGKGWMEEGGNREPLLIRWPGKIAAGVKTEAVVTSPDFYPTLLEVAGLEPKPDQHVDGKSFAPVLRGKPFDRGPVYWHYPHYSNQGGTPTCAIREGDWKLIEYFEDGRVELFNLKDDLSETTNRADDKPQLAHAMQQQLQGWVEEIEGIVPQPNPEWVPIEDPLARPEV